MTYLAPGDSISIDDYTELQGGGAASQLARVLGVDTFGDLTRDGRTTYGLLAELDREDLPHPDVVTVTIGGNDLLAGYFRRAIGDRNAAERTTLVRLIDKLEGIEDRLARLRCPVVLNPIYDPTDGDDARAAEIDLPPSARDVLIVTNAAVRRIAAEHGFLLCDLDSAFQGHGY